MSFISTTSRKDWDLTWENFRKASNVGIETLLLFPYLIGYGYNKVPMLEAVAQKLSNEWTSYRDGFWYAYQLNIFSHLSENDPHIEQQRAAFEDLLVLAGPILAYLEKE